MAARFLTLTLNPAIDCTLTVAQPLRPGGVHAVAGEVRTAGGKGVNVAKAIAAAGGTVRAGGLVGAAEARFYAAELGALGIAGCFRSVPYPTRCNLMVTDPRGREFKLNRPGFPALAYDRGALERYARRAARGADVVVLSGSLPPRFPADTWARLVRPLRELGCAVAVDASGPALARAAAAGPQVLKPNRRELEDLAGRPLRTARARQAAVRRLAEHIEVVIATDGPRGAWFAAGGTLLRAVPPAVAAVDTTGAGDWLLGQFCTDYFPARVLTPRVAARAVAAGAAAVAAPGTPCIPFAAVRRLARQVRVVRTG